MTRSGYSDDPDSNWAIIIWRGAVASALKGKRGQAFLKEMLAAFDALETKRLVANELQQEGEVCALGAVGLRRGLDMERLDPEDYDTVASTFAIAGAMAREIMYENDESGVYNETPEQRYMRMRRWVEIHIVKESA